MTFFWGFLQLDYREVLLYTPRDRSKMMAESVQVSIVVYGDNFPALDTYLPLTKCPPFSSFSYFIARPCLLHRLQILRVMVFIVISSFLSHSSQYSSLLNQNFLSNQTKKFHSIDSKVFKKGDDSVRTAS